MREVDYFIVGAGVAGMTLYRCLEPTRSVIVDPTPARYKIGESIVPQHFFPRETRPLLDKTRALPSASEKVGTLFVSDQGISFFHAYFDAHFAVHVDRRELETMMAAELAIPIVRERVEEIDLERREVRTDKDVYRVRRQILDCSGPAMVLARKLGLARQLWPAFASWAYWDIERTDDVGFWQRAGESGAPFFRYDETSQRIAPAPIDPTLRPSHMTTLTRVRDGVWVWQIPLHHQTRLSLGVVSRHGPVGRDEYETIARAALGSQFQATPRSWDGDADHDRFHVRNRFAWISEKFAGPSWALVGDAAFFGDPVYSVGTAIATNQAIRLAGLLDRWDTGGRELYERVTSELFERARRAYEHWYSGSVTTDHAVAEEIQSGFLNGLAFHARTGEHYRDMWRIAAPADPSADPKATGDAGREVTELVPTSCARAAGFALSRAVLRRRALELHWSSAEAFVVVVSLRAETSRSYREVGPFALSYRTENQQPISSAELAVIDALARSLVGAQMQVLRLLES